MECSDFCRSVYLLRRLLFGRTCEGGEGPESSLGQKISDVKNSCSEERWPGRFAVEWRLHSNYSLGLVHCALNPLERLLCLGMNILVGVKLLRQFAIKLGELSGLHLLHARYQHVDRAVKELVYNVDLVLMQRRIGRAALKVRFHLLHRSLVHLTLNSRQALTLANLGLPVCVGAKLLIASVSTLRLLQSVALKLTLHILASFPKHLLLHLGDVLALLLLLSA